MYLEIIGHQRKAHFNKRCDCALYSSMGDSSAVSGTPDANYFSILSTAVSHVMQPPSIRFNDRVPLHIIDGNNKVRIHSAPFHSQAFML
jgi:hypothetical protein